MCIALIALFGAVTVIGSATSDSMAAPALQSFSEVPEGIKIEALAAAPDLPFRPGDVGAVLLRFAYAPGARLDVPYAGPVLVYVESGTLMLDGVGDDVSILYPPNTIEQPLTGEPLGRTQEAEAPPAGTRAEVDAGGSVYAETGDLGPTHNAGDDELTLLVVQFVSEPRPVDVTKIAIEGPDEP